MSDANPQKPESVERKDTCDLWLNNGHAHPDGRYMAIVRVVGGAHESGEWVVLRVLANDEGQPERCVGKLTMDLDYDPYGISPPTLRIRLHKLASVMTEQAFDVLEATSDDGGEEVTLELVDAWITPEKAEASS